MAVLPSTVYRVAKHTPDVWNERIERATREQVAALAACGEEAIEMRLEELNHEWDMERTLEANASSLILIGTLLGATTSRAFYIVPAIVSGFLLQHALQGWCPPVSLFRRLGFRTATEIEHERYALKALRGDFRDIPEGKAGVDASLRATRP